MQQRCLCEAEVWCDDDDGSPCLGHPLMSVLPVLVPPPHSAHRAGKKAEGKLAEATRGSLFEQYST